MCTRRVTVTVTHIEMIWKSSFQLILRNISSVFYVRMFHVCSTNLSGITPCTTQRWKLWSLATSHSVWKKHNATRCNKRYNVDSLTATHFPKDFQSFAHLFEQLHSWSQGPSTDFRLSVAKRSQVVASRWGRVDAPWCALLFRSTPLPISASHWGVPCDDY